MIAEGVRLGIDIRDANVQKKFLKRFESSRSSPLESLSKPEFAERFLEMAYFQHLIIYKSKDETEVIDALCLGNWLVGVLMSMSMTTDFGGLCAPCAIKANASKNGKAGAEKKLAPLRELKQWTRDKYAAGTWPSANKAAHDLKASVLEHGRKLGATLVDQNAQRTIAHWLRQKN